MASFDYKSGYDLSSLLLLRFSKTTSLIIFFGLLILINCKVKAKLLALSIYYLCGCSLYFCLHDARNLMFGFGLCDRIESSATESAFVASIIDKTSSIRQTDFTDLHTTIKYPLHFLPQIDRLVGRNGVVYARLDGMHSPLKIAITTKQFKQNDMMHSLSLNEQKISDFDLGYIKTKECGRCLIIWEDIARQ